MRVEIQNLNLNYKDLNVLKDINITIGIKNLLQLWDQMVEGKTTLLKAILENKQ